jgi:hypothetical protein
MNGRPITDIRIFHRTISYTIEQKSAASAIWHLQAKLKLLRYQGHLPHDYLDDFLYRGFSPPEMRFIEGNNLKNGW